MAQPALSIRALYDFDAGTSEELTFREGAVMTVLDSSNPDWYYADYEGYSGMVPKNYFEEFYDSGSNNNNNNGSSMADDWDNDTDSLYPSSTQGDGWGNTVMANQLSNTLKAAQKPKAMVARVLYSYEAQQSDELSVEEGEVIQIIDDSDPDWYSAKPISRLGSSGLVPKNYCEIDTELTSTASNSNGKKSTFFGSNGSSADLKASKKEEKSRQKEEERIEKERRREQERLEREQYLQEKSKMREEERRKKAEDERMAKEREAAEKAAFFDKYTKPAEDEINQARVTYFEKRKDGKFYFTVQLYRPNGNNVVYRTYQDFFDFHIKLMELFPDEAGDNGRERTIPYLPGQVIFVTEAISSQRRADLDTYCQELLQLPQKLSHCKWVSEFFASRPGDEAAGAGKELAPWSLGGNKNGTSRPSGEKPSRPLSIAPTNIRSLGNYPPPKPTTTMSAASTLYPPQARSSPPASSSGTARSANGGGGAPSKLSGVKVKVYQGEKKVVAMIVDRGISFRELRDRTFRKLNSQPSQLQYRDEDNDLVTMANDDDVDVAFELHPQKLLLYTR